MLRIISLLTILFVIMVMSWHPGSTSWQPPPRTSSPAQADWDPIPLLATQMTITGVVEKIDRHASRITLRSDYGRHISLPIEDASLLTRIKEGRRMDVKVLSDQQHRPVQIIPLLHGDQTMVL